MWSLCSLSCHGLFSDLKYKVHQYVILSFLILISPLILKRLKHNKLRSLRKGLHFVFLAKEKKTSHTVHHVTSNNWREPTYTKIKLGSKSFILGKSSFARFYLVSPVVNKTVYRFLTNNRATDTFRLDFFLPLFQLLLLSLTFTPPPAPTFSLSHTHICCHHVHTEMSA